MPKNDYIPRKAIYDAVNSIGGCDASEEWAKGYDSAIDAVMDILEGMPAADVEPVRHGEWQEINGIFRCSCCGYSFEHEGYQHFFNYCPNCGAKMDGDKNGA